MTVREATPADWPAIWRFMDEIVAAGETFSWDREIAEADARAIWMGGPPKRTFVAVDDGDRVLGSAVMGPEPWRPGVARGNGELHGRPGRRRPGRRPRARRARARPGPRRRLPGDAFNAVVESNVRAVALWHSLGFEVLATVPEAFDHPTDGLVGLHIMHRPL